MTVICETLHFLWQVYGNFIYYRSDNDPKVLLCKQNSNSSFRWIMFTLIIFGYFFFVIYALVAGLLISLYARRYLGRRNRRSQSTQILRSISRIKFSEELFGALNYENECIICMTPYSKNDMITKLNCNSTHYYHTSCIENWIKQGSNQCPMCREPINSDVQLRNVEPAPVPPPGVAAS